MNDIRTAYEAKYGPGPHLTADAVVILNHHIALIRRKADQMWALPGGFLDPGETMQDCALREFSEECGHDLSLLLPLSDVLPPVVFDTIDRDPRSRIITSAIGIRLPSLIPHFDLIPGDDAEDANWFRLDHHPQLYADHDRIIRVVSALRMETRPWL